MNFSPDPANAADLAACIGTLSYRELSQAVLAAEDGRNRPAAGQYGNASRMMHHHTPYIGAALVGASQT
jgi:hypothetical protein